MDFIKEFGRIGKDDAASAGGKGASLGEMTQAGVPVPPGFVILSSAFERFLDETNLNTEIDTILHSVDQREMGTVENASARIQALILNAKMPEDIAATVQDFYTKLDAQFVAVRSSATAEDSASAAWAGQLDSFLNTTEETLLANVQKCWASLFTPRAIFYRYEKELHKTKISVAVVVQKMVQSEVSGIAFSVHPVTEDYNQLIIEAGFGLGEAIVSGSVTPDSYVVEKEPRRIIDKNITYQSRALWRAANGGNEWRELSEVEGTKPALSDEQALALAEIILRIESHYGFPCDIEWAYEAGTFYITQSRPITTLAPLVPKSKDESEFISPELAHFPYRDFSFLGLWKSDLFAGYFWAHWFNRDILKKLDFSTPFSGCVSLKGGHFFYHKKIIEWGLEEVHKMIADTKGTLIQKFKESAENDFAKLLAEADSFADREPTAENFKRVTEIGLGFMTYWVLSNLLSPEFDSLIAEKAVAEGIPAEDVVGLIPKFPALIDAQHADAKRLLTLLEKRSLGALLDGDTKKLETAIVADKELKKEFDAHLKEFGWIELLNYIGTPLSLERLLDQLKTAAKSSQHEHHQNVKKLSKEFQHILNIAADVGFVRQGGAESSSIFHFKMIDFLEKTAKALGLEYREMLNLVPEEIIAGLEGTMSRAGLQALVQKRLNYNWIVYSDIGTEDLVVVDEKQDVDTLHKLMVPTADENADTLIGQIGNKGKVQGRASVILASDDFPKFVEGSVLVTTMTTPDFVILMQKSVAIVTDIGGMLSHASIVSRELHKPCVIGTKFATQVLHDGDLVEVDADNGVVRILERAGGEVVKKKLTEGKTRDQDDFVWALEYVRNHSFDIKEARASLFMSDIVFSTYAEKNCFGQSYSPVFIPCTEKSLKQVIAEEVMNDLERGIWDVFINAPEKFASALKEANDLQSEIDQLALTPEKLKALKTEELNQYFSSLTELATLWWKYGSIGEEKGLVVEEKIIPLLEKNHGFSKDEAREYVMTMTTPSEQSIFSKERAAFLDLCIEGGSDMEKIKKYAEKYFYARSDFYSVTVLNSASVSELIAEQRKKTSVPKLKEELAHISENLTNLLERKKALARKIKLTEEEQSYLSYFSSLQEWLDTRKLSMQKHFTYIFYFLIELSERTGIAYDTLSLMTVAEIKGVVKGEKVDLKEIQARESAHVLVYKEGHERLCFTGNEAEKLRLAISGSEAKMNSGTIRGTVASSGKNNKIIRGIVRLVIDPSKEEFNEGEILVTSMTRPEFVPIMKSALAIITDEGGIACHAAIVSRELGIPCIIGTKIATQVLKDGDLVEVDAYKGIVRILERGDERVKKTPNESAVRLIKKTDWHSDWSGPFSLFGLSLPTNTYFDGMEKYFGKGLSQVFVAFKNGVAFSRLPEGEYHDLGVHLAKKAEDSDFVKEWASQFKKLADKIMKEIPATAEEFVKKLPDLLPHYQAYGAHNAATKIAFDVGYDTLSKKHKELLEEARKYSETFYKDDADTIEKALRFLAQKTGYAYEEIYMLTYDELRSYLDTGILPPQDMLKKRWVASGVHFTRDKTTLLSSEELEQIEKSRLTGQKEIAGQTAYGGKVRGRCHIVLDYQNARLEKGEILVTGMTDPNFVELMKKASAIVTDGGGMLSHAAIVARELKKPCVIGTKIATQVLKDGDLVEVDADNGVVRKIF